MSPSHVIVVGAGIVGAACADACARAGMQVTVVEASGIGGGATAAGMGHLVVMDDSPALLALTSRSVQLWRALAPQLPTAAEYMPCGTIWVASDAMEMEEAARKLARYREHDIEAAMLDAPALARQEPHLRKGLAGGLLVPGDSVLYPPVAAGFLLARSGVTVRLGARVVSLGQGVVRLHDGSILRAPAILNATGVAAASLTPGLPVRARMGHLLITQSYPGWLRHQLVELGYCKSAHDQQEESVAFNAQPRATGQVLIGSSRQFVANTQAALMDRSMLARMLRRAQLYMPTLAGLSALRTWTGFRAATPDALPLIGPSPADPSLWLATGHEGLGITTALATAELLAALLSGAPAPIAPEPYFPARFLETPHRLATAQSAKDAYAHHD
ncbi:MAG: NAD(P)/FAD-dependent oxidoreductase [Terriglobales bacterium]